MNNFIVVAYYTAKYKKEAIAFLETCCDVGVPVYCQYVEDQGGWDKNTRYKPTFIKECLECFTCNILYVDVDARFMAFPFWAALTQCDVGFYKGDVWGHGNEEVLSGTLFFRNNEISRIILDKYESLCNITAEGLEQTFLERSIPPEAKVGYLPIEYCAIYDSPKVTGRDLVIKHTQASRRLSDAR